jgi:transposase
VVGKILYLRQNYHFGPAKIAMYLKRYHDVEVSHSGVWRILKRLDQQPQIVDVIDLGWCRCSV